MSVFYMHLLSLTDAAPNCVDT